MLSSSLIPGKFSRRVSQRFHRFCQSRSTMLLSFRGCPSSSVAALRLQIRKVKNCMKNLLAMFILLFGFPITFLVFCLMVFVAQ